MVSSYFKEWLVAKNLLQNIDHSVRLIQDRTNMIVSCNDFLETPSGMEKLDAVCMQLIAIGEAVTKLDKVTDGKLLEREPEVPWRAIKGVRNFIAHDYFDVDVEEILHIIKIDLPNLSNAVTRLLKSLEE